MRVAALATALAATLALALALALAACWTERAPQRPRMSSTPVPGTLWVTPAQPWRASQQPAHIAAAGDTAMLSSEGGWIARFDLARGVAARERRLAGLAIYQVLALPGGGWLLVGRRDGRVVAATLDEATLEPTVVVTGGELAQPDEPLQRASRAVVLDEGIALAVEGLPLAIYDPATWQVRRVVDPAVDWRWAAGGGKTLHAVGAGGLVRFDLATGASANLGTPKYRDGGSAGHVVTRSIENGRWVFDAVGPAKTSRIAADGWSAAVDPVRDRIAVHEGATIHVHALAGGARTGSYELGESGHGYLSAMAFAGERLIVAVEGIVRVIDLATGAVTPAGDPPYGTGQLAVTAAGEVLVVGMHALRFADGKLVASARIGFDEPAIGDPYQAARYALVRKPEARRVEVFELGAPAPIHAWETPEDKARGVWLGRAGRAVIETTGFRAQRALFLGAGALLEPITPIKFESFVDDVDVDGGHALINVEATVHVVRLRDAAALHALPMPGCEEFGTGRLERGGDRLLLNDGLGNVAVYRRSTGERLAAASIDETIGDAIAFVPGRDEILIAARDALVLWDPPAGTLRRLGGLDGLDAAAVSPDARRVALAFHDGRIALADLDVLRAAMTPDRAAAMPEEVARAACPSGDPFALDPDHADPGDPDADPDP